MRFTLRTGSAELLSFTVCRWSPQNGDSPEYNIVPRGLRRLAVSLKRYPDTRPASPDLLGLFGAGGFLLFGGEVLDAVAAFFLSGVEAGVGVGQ